MSKTNKNIQPSRKLPLLLMKPNTDGSHQPSTSSLIAPPVMALVGPSTTNSNIIAELQKGRPTQLQSYALGKIGSLTMSKPMVPTTIVPLPVITFQSPIFTGSTGSVKKSVQRNVQFLHTKSLLQAVESCKKSNLQSLSSIGSQSPIPIDIELLNKSIQRHENILYQSSPVEVKSRPGEGLKLNSAILKSILNNKKQKERSNQLSFLPQNKSLKDPPSYHYPIFKNSLQSGVTNIDEVCEISDEDDILVSSQEVGENQTNAYNNVEEGHAACECCPIWDHNYTKCSLLEKPSNLSHISQTNALMNGKDNIYIDRDDVDDDDSNESNLLQFSTRFQTSNEGEQVMVVNPLLDCFSESDDSQSCNVDIDNHSMENRTVKRQMNRSNTSNEISLEGIPSCESQADLIQDVVTDPSREWKIDSVFSLAKKTNEMMTEDSDEQDIDVEGSCTDMETTEGKRTFESMTFSLKESKWKDFFKACFVVLESLPVSKNKEICKDGVTSHCSHYCRLRTLNMMCSLNLLSCCDCNVKENDKETKNNECVSDSSTITASSDVSNLEVIISDSDSPNKFNTTKTIGSPHTSDLVDTSNLLNTSQPPDVTKDLSVDQSPKDYAKLKLKQSLSQCKGKKKMLSSKPTDKNSDFLKLKILKQQIRQKRKEMYVRKFNRKRTRKYRPNSNRPQEKRPKTFLPPTINGIPVDPVSFVEQVLFRRNEFISKGKAINPNNEHRFGGNFSTSTPHSNSDVGKTDKNKIVSSSSLLQHILSKPIQWKRPALPPLHEQQPIKTLSKNEPANSSSHSIPGIPKLINGKPAPQPQLASSSSSTPSSSSNRKEPMDVPYSLFSVSKSGTQVRLVPSANKDPVSPNKLKAAMDSFKAHLKTNSAKFDREKFNYFLIKVDNQQVLIKTSPCPSNPSSNEQNNSQLPTPYPKKDILSDKISEIIVPVVRKKTPSVLTLSDSLCYPSLTPSELATKDTQDISLISQASFQKRDNASRNTQQNSAPIMSQVDPLHKAMLPTPVPPTAIPQVSSSNSITNSTRTKSTLKRRFSGLSSEEQRKMKRKKLEAKYPLPPGVVIKSEPLTEGYELDNNWCVTSEVDIGVIPQEDNQHPTNTMSQIAARTSSHLGDQTLNPSGVDMTNSDDDQPPVLENVGSVSLDLDIEELNDTMAVNILDETPPVLQPMAPSLSSSLIELTDGTENDCIPSSTDVTVSLNSFNSPESIPHHESGYNSLSYSSSSETVDSSPSLPSSSSSDDSRPGTQSSSGSRLQQLKDLLKKKTLHVEKIQRIRSTLPEINLDSI